MEQLKLLMDYTRFHIGIYVTLGAVGVGTIEADFFNVMEFLPVIVLLIVAGASGGIIASNIPLYNTWDDFHKSKLTVFRFKTLQWQCWAAIEHYSFWVAVFLTIRSLILHESPNLA